MNNCNKNNCNTGCPEIVSGRCVKYTDKYLETIVVGSSDTFNSAMIKINNYLLGMGNSGLQKVIHENTSSIIFSGDGTSSSPLTATYTGSTVTPNLQQVTTQGATTNVPITGVPGTLPNHLATVSQLGTGGGEPLWIGSFNEQIISTNGVINNLVITSNLLRFTGTGVVITGITTQTTRAKTVVLINNTGFDINLQHLSTSSATANQLYILGEGLTAGSNVALGNNSAVTFVYSNSKWRVSDWFGDGYHPNLVGTGTRVIEVLPSGKEQATESFDYEYFRPDVTTDQTDSQLNILYPGAYRGTTIYCKNITGGGMAFKKDDDVLNTWIRIPFII